MNKVQLARLLSLYKDYCLGELSPLEVEDEMLSVAIEIDRLVVSSKDYASEQRYYEELQFLLFDIMQYEHTGQHTYN